MKNKRAYRCLERQDVVMGSFVLKTIQDDDIEDIRIWRNEQMDVLRQSLPISPEQQNSYFDQKIWPSMDREQPENIILTFFEDGKRIGYGGLVHLAWEHRRAEISFLLNPKYVDGANLYNKYFSIYLEMIKHLAFSVLRFNRVFTETYVFRTDHIRVLEACGFQFEGRMKQHISFNNEFIDSLIHGVIHEK